MYNRNNESAVRGISLPNGSMQNGVAHLMHQYTSKDIARFWSKVNKNGSIPAHCPELGACWEWTAGERVKGLGYGGFIVSGIDRKSLRSHRIAWELTNGEVPDGLYVLHKCDNPKCCNPNHLFLGTPADNINDMVNKKRHSLGEKNGLAKLTTSQVEEIRRRYAIGNITQRKLGLEFGVSHILIGYIVRYEIWKDVQ